MAETNCTSTSLTSALARGLTTPRNTSRAPDNFETSLELACSEPESSISRVFLRAGFQAWFAYFLASQEGNADGLNQLPPEDLTNVANQVACVRLHESVEHLFSYLFHGWRGKKRLECLKSISIQAPTSLEPPSSGSRPTKRARISIRDLAIQGQVEGDLMADAEPTHEPQLSVPNNHNADDVGPRAMASTFVALYRSIGFDVDPRTQLAWPAASNLGLVFPMYLTSVIVKANGKAWLKVSYANDFTKCELEFFILASATQHVASQLFDLHITADGHRRGILLDNNVAGTIGGSITWAGSPLAKTKKILGIQAMEAYEHSPSRAQELQDGLTGITKCLSMEIWPEVDCPSRLRLRAEVGKLSAIANSLWPAFL